MKFVIAVVILAIASSANAGIGPVVDVASSWSPVGSWGPALVNGWGSHLGLPGAHGGLWAPGPWGPAAAWQAPSAAWPAPSAAWPAPSPWGIAPWSPLGAPHISLSQGLGHGPISHGPIAHGPVAAPLIAHGHEAKYVASNRGSVHVAPLVGHVQSVSSTNLEPAPGTTW